MYTDTKTSCESVTTASKVVDDPEVDALHNSFRTQRDRLLAWGLDWSDASAAQPNDIDESLTQAGFSDVVESVMSSIQDLLHKADRLQHGGATMPSNIPSKGGRADAPSKDTLKTLPVKAHWSDEDIARSRSLLADLTACIDTLYDLSSSRRNMSSGGHRSRQQTEDSVYTQYSDSKSYHGASIDTKRMYQSPSKQQEAFDYSPYTNAPTRSPFEQSQFEQPSSKHYIIDRSALQLSGAAHDNCPPPYEMVAASSNSRAIGRMPTSASPFLRGSKDSSVTILLEFVPMIFDSAGAVTVPENKRMDHVHRTLDQLVQNARVSHLGLMRFLGYYIDMPNSRYAFIYQMPLDYFPFLRNPTDLLDGLKPKPLVSLFQTGDDYQLPNLETRFRLAYDLLMSVLQLRSQNLVHGNINSSNVIIFPGLTNSNDEIGLTENLRRPYLTSIAEFSGNGTSPEPTSSSIYRHPDDKRSLDDDAAWAYDLYSLGLVLLEIGLWTPISRLWKMKYTPSMFKQRIENVYLQKLGPKCGSAYLHVVQLCLDAPNFHLSTQPFDDFNLRVPQTYHYPVLDLSEPDSIFSFAMNFIYTMSKIMWACCRIDIFSAPGAEELDDCLPLALAPRPDAVADKQPIRDFGQVHEQTVPLSPGPFAHPLPTTEMKLIREKMGLQESKPRKRTFKKLTNVEIPQEHLNEWNFQMMPRLRKLLQKILKDSSESCGVTLMMTGESAENARTTICVTCASAKKVRAALKKYYVLDRDDWDLLVLRGDIQRSKVPRKKRRRPAKTGPERPDLPASFDDPNPCYQQRPLCGASIGAFMNEEHLPPVTYGGAILVDGMPYGMTVHHMLESPSDQEEDGDESDTGGPLRSAGNWPREPASQDPGLMYTWCDNDPSEVDLEFDISEDEEGDDISVSLSLEGTYDDYTLSEGYSSDEGLDGDDPFDDEDAASIGDTAGVEPGDEPPLFVTQPAIDDVREDFFPSLEDRDDEHLATHAFGFVHASSGVRRWTRQGMRHEIDWALIKINEERSDARNIVYDKAPSSSALQNLPRQRPQSEPIFLNDIARLQDLGGLKVHCCGRTSGLQTGHISRAMTLVKLHGRHSFSTSFSVDGNFGGK